MRKRTVYIVLETHWWYDDQDWNSSIPERPFSAYATRQQAEAALFELENPPKQTLIWDEIREHDEYEWDETEKRYSVVEVEVEEKE